MKIAYLNVDDDYISRRSRLVHSKILGYKIGQNPQSWDTKFSIPGTIEHDRTIKADIFHANVPVIILWRDNIGTDRSDEIFRNTSNGIEISRLTDFISEDPEYTDISKT